MKLDIMLLVISVHLIYIYQNVDFKECKKSKIVNFINILIIKINIHFSSEKYTNLYIVVHAYKIRFIFVFYFLFVRV